MGRSTDGDRAGRRRSRLRRPVLATAIAGLLLVGGGLAALAQETHGVEVADNEFAPEAITIEAGDTIEWEHTGVNPHTVTADDGSFDSHPDCPQGPCMMTGDTYEQTFDEPGEYGYYCKIHGSPGSGMAGTVVVTAAEEEPESGEESGSGTETETDEGAGTDAEADDGAEDDGVETESQTDAGAEQEAGTDVEAEASAAGSDEASDETLPETGRGVVPLALVAVLALGVGGLWLRWTSRSLG